MFNIKDEFIMKNIKSFNNNIIYTNTNLSFALVFGAYVLIQFITLRCANQAGRNYLSLEKQEYVYCCLQIAVIAGYLLHALAAKILRSHICQTAALGVWFVGAELMLFLTENSLVYLVITGVTALCLGFVGGAVYLRLSQRISSITRSGMAVGFGYSAAIAFQYFFQLQRTIKPVLAILVAASCGILLCLLLRKQPENKLTKHRQDVRAPMLKPVFSVLITLAMLVFTNYYNSYIHHLQVASGYTEYNVYSLPRLMMIPAVLTLCIVGDIKSGRYLPIVSMCVVTVSLLNTALLGQETYLLNMCLFYISLSAVISYYHLTFLRLAPATARPALWAPMGRIIDSLSVILTFIFRFARFSTAAVLTADIAALAVMVVFMAMNGDLMLYAPGGRAEAHSPDGFTENITETNTQNVTNKPERNLPAGAYPPPSRSEEEQTNYAAKTNVTNKPERNLPAGAYPPADPFLTLQEQFGISPKEMKVLRELVTTDDKQDVVAARLNISVSTLRHHVTSIYKKTGVQSRLALSKLIETDRHS